ncbi:MAG TPA: hypothetical protein VFL12_13605, partial [Thermoanaerobaculia bacterium]|nr:hypothetical protein [Thermoanaerobaculia bacterium]
ARGRNEALWVVADAGRSGSSGGWALVDPEVRRASSAARAEDVAPTAVTRLGIPAARDLAGAPLASLFAPGALEPSFVASYGERRAAEGTRPTETGREYLEKLKSLGYLR